MKVLHEKDYAFIYVFFFSHEFKFGYDLVS